MECNKEEALRAKEIAEQKFMTKDLCGAKKFALKALNLFPELEGINQMISTLDVYLAGEMKINGENDWYSILCVNASSDDDTIRKQYRNLALQLHPDKNMSIGAEGAFQLISEAWNILSDESRKSVYDQKINVKKASQRKKRNRSARNGTNAVYNFMKPSITSPKSNTFWTSCNKCKMQYEYLRVYLNHNLLCPNCHEAFMAVETGIPSNGSSTNISWSNPQQKPKSKRNSSHVSENVNYNSVGFQWGPYSDATDSSTVSNQAANMVHKTYEKVKRERVVDQPRVKKEEAIKRKNLASKRDTYTSAQYSAGVNVNSFNNNNVEQPTKTGGITSEDAVADASRTVTYTRISKLSRVMAQFDKRSLLMEKAKVEMGKKLEEWKAAESVKLTEKAKVKQKQKVKENDYIAMTSKDENSFTNNFSSDVRNDTIKQISKQESIIVPDPEFHDFDKDRLEKLFEKDQVWATYDSEDGMPRFYALIQKIISLRPFKCRMSFLNSKSNAELGPMNWVGSGFAKTCGDFRVGRYAISDTANIFSHRVYGEKGARGVIRIYPRKSETWALYKNWSPGWNELTPDEVIHQYDIVEVIDDYKEEGILVTPLVKIAGFRAIFHKHTDPNEVEKIPKEEMFRFSHQVPSYLLTGDEAHNAPKGCRELDPAAIPSDLLQELTQFSEEELYYFHGASDDVTLNV